MEIAVFHYTGPTLLDMADEGSLNIQKNGQ